MKKLLSALVVVAVWQVAVAVQTGPGGIEGYVSDADGGVLPGVTVEVSSPAAPAQTVTTDARGRFVVRQLPAGQYQVGLSLTGFRTSRGSVSVRAGGTSAVTFQLAVGSLSETLTVRSPTPSPAQVPPPSPPPVTNTPIRVGGDIQEPLKIADVRPVYPAAAVAAGAEGDVVIEAVIGRDGAVSRARVLQGVPLLNVAALDAVRQWRYTPTRLNGQPVEVMATVTIRFVR